jgi:hypothetical protein
MRIPKKRQRSRQILDSDRTKIELSEDAVAFMEKQRAALWDKFGREPAPDDPVFFDPNNDEPTRLNGEYMITMASEAMRAAGVDEELIYAYQEYRSKQRD